MSAMDPEVRKINANNNKSNAISDISISSAESGSKSTEIEIIADALETLQNVTDAVDGPDKEIRDELILLDELNEESDENSSGNADRDIRKLVLLGLAGKKTMAQGMMDIALITANANQLRYILEFNRGSHTYHITVTLIGISLFLQIAVGMFLIFKGRYHVKGESKSVNAKRINMCVLLCVFLITIVNVFICGFSTVENNNNNNLAAKSRI